MADGSKTYEGSCHCGSIRYRVKLGLGPDVSCNGSICQRTGALLAFVGAAGRSR